MIRIRLNANWKTAGTSIITVLFLFVVMNSPTITLGNDRSDEAVAVQTYEDQEQPHIVFLINEEPNNYEAHNTIPPFADMLHRNHGFQTTVIHAEGEVPAIRFPGLDVLDDADLLVIFFRRAALPQDQLNAIRNYLNEGKPLVGIRTANHAFAVRSEDGEIPDGYEDWWEFVPDILGQENRGYGSVAQGTAVSIVPEAADHPVLEGIPSQWQSPGNIYRAELLDDEATLLLTGSAGEGDLEPIAYTRTAGESRIFYTSLGYPDDFDVPQYRMLLLNGIRWALDEN